MNSSTKVDNPVNQIASLLTAEAAEPEKEETPELDTKPDESQEPDESQPQESENDESLATEEESAESSDDGIDTINDLAVELDIDITDMYAMNLKLSRGEHLPDGGAKTLGELKTFYEQNADIDSLKEDIKQREQDLENRSNELSEAPQISNELLQARAQVLAIQDQYNRTDWQGLRFNNPAEYSALQSDFRSQFELAKNNETLANQTVEEHTKQAMSNARDRLLESMPELKDDEVRAKVEVDVGKFASRYGYTKTDMDGITDPRLMRLLIEASRIDVARTTVKDKKVEKVPISNKPAVRQSLPGRKAALKRLTEKAKASGDRRDQTRAVAALLSG